MPDDSRRRSTSSPVQQPSRGMPRVLIAVAIIILVVIVGYLLLTRSSGEQLSRIAATTGLKQYCQTGAIQPDCDAYASAIMSSSEAQVITCEKQYPYPTQETAFYGCLLQAGVIH